MSRRHPASLTARTAGRAGRPRREVLARRGSVLARLADILLGKAVTLVLAALAFAVGLATFIILARGAPFGLQPGRRRRPGAGQPVGGAAAGRGAGRAADPRLGGAAPRLGRLAAACAAGAAVQRRGGGARPSWSPASPSRSSISASRPGSTIRCARRSTESLQVSRGYLEEHRDNIRAVALEMANDLTRAGQFLSADPSVFAEVLATQTTLRGLTEAVIYDPLTRPGAGRGRAVRRHGRRAAAARRHHAGAGRRRRGAGRRRRHARAGGGAAQFDAAADADDRPAGRSADPRPHARAPSRRSPNTSGSTRTGPGCRSPSPGSSRSWRCWCCWPRWLIGLVLANQIARPIGRLIHAAERVRGGDLAVRVAEAPTGDELAGLSRAFNRMTGQLAAQRGELMDAYSQIDERRRFTETVLSGVSAGVIGLDASGRIELPNRAADELLGLDLLAAIGRELAEVVPEFAELLHEARGVAGTRAHRRDPDRPADPPAHAAGADRRRSVGRAHRRLRGHVRRHHRTAVGPAQGRLGRCRAPHRARDQESADADPACRGTAEAAVRHARSPRIPTRSASAPTPSSAMSAISAAWSMSSPPSRACRSR